MSRTGCRHHNAAGGPFFRPRKHEWTNHARFANLEELSTVTLHQTADDRSPDQYEAESAPVTAA